MILEVLNVVVFNLESLIRDRGISVSELARRSGLNRPNLYDPLYNRSEKVALKTLDKLCGALDCEISDLLKREVSNND